MAATIPFPLELVTERLVIRSPTAADAPLLCEAVAESIEELRPWMPWADHVPSLTEAEENCARAVKRFQDGEDFQVRFFLRETGLFLGGSGLHRVDWSVPKFEIGYWVRRSHSGQGYVTETVAKLTRFAFEELAAERVEIRTSTRNVKSWRVPERLGFNLEGILHSDMRNLDGSLRDTKVYAKTRDAWPRADAQTKR